MIRIYKISPAALLEVKKIIERPEAADAEGKWQINPFARNGYTLRDGKSMGLDENSYLYIAAVEEKFFAQNEKQILIEGVTKLAGAEFEKVKSKIEEEQSGAAVGVGAVFGDL